MPGGLLVQFDRHSHKGIWGLSEGRVKNKQKHCVPLNPLAMEILQEAKEMYPNSDWVFPSSVGKRGEAKEAGVHPLVGSSVDHAVRRNLSAFGMARGTPHDLRRSASTLMTSSGVSRFDLKRVINHTDSEVTGVYDRYAYLNEKRAALLKLEKKLLGIVNPGEPAKILPLKMKGGSK